MWNLFGLLFESIVVLVKPIIAEQLDSPVCCGIVYNRDSTKSVCFTLI